MVGQIGSIKADILEIFRRVGNAMKILEGSISITIRVLSARVTFLRQRSPGDYKFLNLGSVDNAPPTAFCRDRWSNTH